MKLYATVQSERATKGQGGEYLDIEVKGEDKRVFLELKITELENHYQIKGYVIHPEHAPNRRSEHYLEYLIGKGKKQKDECNHDWDNYGKCCNCGQWNTK